MFDIKDLRGTIVPKSDQLNAEQLLASPLTITVTDVRVSDSAEQPVTIGYQGDEGRPYKPCKTMRKVLILAWGQDGSGWAGKSMTLYCDNNIMFGGVKVGGIRISHVSGIERDIQVSLTATRGKKALHTIKALKVPTKKAAPSKMQARADQIKADVAAHNTTGAVEAYDAWTDAECNEVWALLDNGTQEAMSKALAA
jgi:hypothetical protein